MSDSLDIDGRLAIPLAEIELRASRSSGPGGQHVNTADTRVELRWNVAASPVLSDAQRARIREALARRINKEGEIVLFCGTRRSQHRNRQEVLDRLADLLRRALAPRRPRRPTAPTEASRRRRLDAKRRRSEVKQRRRRPPRDED